MIFTIPSIGLAMPTDEDWGRLYNFNTTGDAGLIMPPRSYYFRDFFAGSWKDISLGFIYCAMGNGGGDTANIVAERLVEDAPINLFHFGLTKSNNGTVPVGDNPSFIGLRGVLGGITQIMTSPLQLAQLLYAQVSSGLTVLADNPVQIPLMQGVTGTPFAMFGIRLIYNQNTGNIAINHSSQTNVALANDAENTTKLVEFLKGISGNQSAPEASFVNYNVLKLNSFYIYWPYFHNRLKLHAVGVIKNA